MAAEELQPAVRKTLDAVRAAAPNAKIMVIGPVWTEPDPPSNVLQTRDVIQTEAGLTETTPVVDASATIAPEAGRMNDCTMSLR